MGLFSSIAGYFGNKSKAKAAGKAADAQVASLQQGVDAVGGQQALFQQQINPFIQGGQAALAQQMALLGLGGGASGGMPAAPIGPGGLSDGQAQQLLQDRPDVLAEFQRASAAGDPNSPAFAAGGLTSATDYARHWYDNMGGSSSYQVPGVGGSAGAGAVDPATAQQDAITALQKSPLYQSLMRNGQDSILQSSSATGGLRGGNIQRSLADFGSDTLAGVIQQQLSNLGGLSSQGQSATLNSGQIGAGAADSLANLYAGQGSARAGGIIGKANFNAAAMGNVAQGVGQVASAFLPSTGIGGQVKAFI